MDVLRVATRKSPLALAQTAIAVAAIESRTRTACEIVGITTRGDNLQHRSLSAIGGDGVFSKELQQALLDGRADAAVHSLKDLPSELTPMLSTGAVLERGPACDVLLSRDNRYKSIEALPLGAVVGTGSPRRASQLRAVRADLQVRDVRGNVDTRVRKLLDGEYDALVLALAGVQRLGLLAQLGGGCALDAGVMVPAPGQGAIFVQCRADAQAVLGIIMELNDAPTALAVAMERAFLQALGSGCTVPAGCLVNVGAGGWQMQAFIGAPDGSTVLRRSIEGAQRDAPAAITRAREVAEEMLSAGGRELLADTIAASRRPA
jgi:hydroxymethylbilane synthase